MNFESALYSPGPGRFPVDEFLDSDFGLSALEELLEWNTFFISFISYEPGPGRLLFLTNTSCAIYPKPNLGGVGLDLLEDSIVSYTPGPGVLFLSPIDAGIFSEDPNLVVAAFLVTKWDS